MSCVYLPVGNSRNGWSVSFYNGNVGLHALVHLPAQPACGRLEHLQVNVYVV